MVHTFTANGKLLISGEYLVLQGALALAAPCKFGQALQVENHDETPLRWQSLQQDGSPWFDGIFDRQSLLAQVHAGDSILLQVLKQAISANPSFVDELLNHKATSRLQFPADWGLGSSSTLIHLIAQWSKTDPIAINTRVTGGSGYDIACAGAHRPILFRKDAEGAIWDMVHFTPPSPGQIFFIHLNEKSDSKTAVRRFLAGKKQWKEEAETISEISEALLFCDVFEDFMVLLREHEDVMQYVLQREKIQSALFADFPGVVKSLGAWGGDFVMAAAEMEPREICGYFRDKGFDTILNYNEMILFT